MLPIYVYAYCLIAVEYVYSLLIMIIPDYMFKLLGVLYKNNSNRILYSSIISQTTQINIVESFKLYLLLDNQLQFSFNTKYFCHIYRMIIASLPNGILIIAYEHNNIVKYGTINIKNGNVMDIDGNEQKNKHNIYLLR